MSISINGIGETVITLKTATAVNIGDFITLSGNGLAVKAAVNAEPVGVCISKNNSYVGIQIAGGMTVPQDGTLTIGYHPVKTAAEGLALATAGKPRLIISVTENTADIIL